ncbi:MAG: TIGR01777 family protein [Ferruginibacter sp.]|nr:TIGR01777 family protein [Cytophagales bacterium]
MPQHVLITGGSGLIGTRLTELLRQQGYSVAHLSRPNSNRSATPTGVRVHEWDVAKGELDERALPEADYLIHLAGAGIADERWTESRKKEIIDSRVESTRLLARKLKAAGRQSTAHPLKAFLSASAIGVYGADTGGRILTESSAPGRDFLADVTLRWEAAAEEVAQLGIRTVKMRTGIVLSEKGGALAKIAQPIRLGAGAALGSGRQILSWIHLDDLARLFIYAMEDETMRGAYNAVAPNPVTNDQLTKLAADALGKPLWLPRVPAFALRLAFGEMAAVVLGGNHVLNGRVAKETDFTYRFTDAREALENLLKE